MHAGRMQAGLVLALLGGVRRGHAEQDCVPVRGDIHLLMCGDPGLGKSQLLQARLRILAVMSACWPLYSLLLWTLNIRNPLCKHAMH